MVVVAYVGIAASCLGGFLRSLVGGCHRFLGVAYRLFQDGGVHVCDGDLEVVVLRIQGDRSLNLHGARPFLCGAGHEHKKRSVEGGDVAVVGHRHHQPGHAKVLRLGCRVEHQQPGGIGGVRTADPALPHLHPLLVTDQDGPDLAHGGPVDGHSAVSQPQRYLHVVADSLMYEFYRCHISCVYRSILLYIPHSC